MMTIQEMAELTCDKVNRSDSASVDLCKRFINRRHKLIYNSYLWKDSLDTVTELPNGPSDDGRGASYTNELIMPRWMERVIAIREGDSNALSVEEQSLFFRRDPSLIGRVGSVSAFQQIRPFWWNLRNPSTTVYFSSAVGGDDGKNVYLTDDALGQRRVQSLVGTYTGSFTFLNNPQEGFRLSKDVTSGTVVFWQGVDAVGGSDVLGAGDTVLRYERVKLLQDPAEAKTFLVLGKRRVVDMHYDSDTSVIQNIDDALIAHAQADMLERDRQYAKAELKRTEATMQVRSAIDQERNQSASVSLIVPATYHTIFNGDDI